MTATPSPWCIPLAKGQGRLALVDIARFGVLAGLTFGAKFVMAGLPNIEPVSLMVMLFAVTFGRKGIFPVYVYVVLEILVFGIHIWNIYYLYIWLLLFLAAWLLRGMTSRVGWALVSGVFGLLFGALCGIVDIFIGGFAYAVAKWISGIPYDIIHCVANFVIALVLFQPLRKLLDKLYTQLKRV